MTDNKRLLAAIMSFSAFQLWVVGDTFSKLGGATLPVYQMAFVYSLVASVIVCLAVMVRGGWKSLQIKNRPLIAARCVLSCLGVYCCYIGITHLPLADFYTFVFTIPLITATLAPILLKEPTHRDLWVAISTGFIGVLIAVQFGMAQEDGLSLVGVLAMCINVFAYSFGQIIIRHGSKTETKTVLALYPLAFNLLVSAVVCAINWDDLVFDLKPNFFLMLTGVFGVTGLYLNITALKQAPAALVVSLLYTQMIGGVLSGYLIWHHTPAPATMLGAGIIVCAGIYLILRESRRSRDMLRPTEARTP
jgi:drug/metabolite transporter (DMT)-like permease